MDEQIYYTSRWHFILPALEKTRLQENLEEENRNAKKRNNRLNKNTNIKFAMKPLSWTRGLEGDWTFILGGIGGVLGAIGGYW